MDPSIIVLFPFGVIAIAAIGALVQGLRYAGATKVADQQARAREDGRGRIGAA